MTRLLPIKEMTDSDLFREFLKRETAGHKTIQGADVDGIVEDLAAETGRTTANVREIVLLYTVAYGRG